MAEHDGPGTCIRCPQKARVQVLDRETGQITDLCTTCVIVWAVEFDDVEAQKRSAERTQTES